MKTLTRDELRSLVAAENGSCVSLYAKTANAGLEMLMNPGRLRSRLGEAKQQLEHIGWKPAEAARLLRPASELLGNIRFWQKQEQGLAVFVCRGFHRVYQLPYDVAPLSVVGLSFHLKSLLPLIAYDGRLWNSGFQQHRTHSAEAIETGLANAHATDQIESAVTAAFEGRADKCFVSLNEQRWGTFNESRGSIRFLDRADPRACDLLDFAAVQALLHGGEAFPVSTVETMPARKPLSVLLRC